MHALTVLGGVPTGHVWYDNLKAAVAQVLGFSRQRVEIEPLDPSAGAWFDDASLIVSEKEGSP
jgi:hypothetical protein